MNIKNLHQGKKPISTASLFKTVEGNVTSIQLMAGAHLKEHITKVPALLFCLTGEVIFENENGIRLTLITGDYVKIEPLVKHWLNAKNLSNVLLIK